MRETSSNLTLNQQLIDTEKSNLQENYAYCIDLTNYLTLNQQLMWVDTEKSNLQGNYAYCIDLANYELEPQSIVVVENDACLVSYGVRTFFNKILYCILNFYQNVSG